VIVVIVLVNFNYRIGVHMNFVQSRISALVCSPQSEYGCQLPLGAWPGGNGAMPTPIPKFLG